MTKSKHLAIFFCATALGLSALSDAQSSPAAWSTSTNYQVGDLAQYNHNIYRAIYPNHGNNPTTSYSDWELFNARFTLTLNIGAGQPFPDLVTAWRYILNASVSPASAIHLRIVTSGGAFNETFSSQFSLNHPFGASIDLAGDNPSRVTLSFPGSSGLTIDSGHTFQSIRYLTLATNNTGDNTVAINASNNAVLPSVDGVSIVGSWAVYAGADHGAIVNFVGPVNWSQGVDRYADAEFGAQITLSGVSNLSGGLYNGDQQALRAGFGARIAVAAGSHINTGGFTGAFATDMGQLILNGVIFHNNIIDVAVWDGSTAHLRGATYGTPSIGSGSFVFTD